MSDGKKHEIFNRQGTNLAHETARDASAAAIGALVGVALGGVPGAIAGAAVSPVLTSAVKLAVEVLARRGCEHRRVAEARVCNLEWL